MTGAASEPLLTPFAPDLWLVGYGVRYFAMDITARTTVIRLADGRVLLHSPCAITPALKSAIEAIGPVAWIVAPGTFHHLHAGSAQAAFPGAKTWICPGIEAKRPDLAYDAVLADVPPPDWAGQLDQVVVRGNRLMSEVAFFHRASKTLILVDLIELITDRTPGVGWRLRAWWMLFRMWNRPRPAPEYRMGWNDRGLAAECLQRILQWDFERIVISHGDLVTENTRSVAQDAWASVLRRG